MGLVSVLGPEAAVQVNRGLMTIQASQQEEIPKPDPKVFGARLGALRALRETMGPQYIADNWAGFAQILAPDVKAFVGVDLGGEWTDEYDQALPALAEQFNPEKAEAGFTLSPGQTRYGPRGEEVASAPAAPPKPEQTLEEKVAEAAALTEARKKVEQRYTSAKESKEDTKKAEQFKSAVPVINAVSELSERINTLQGVVAKAAGTAERAKAELNLNDDVSEYQALVMGFTPLVARALGHTGVLTEQDVQSVRALFPRPEDSKSLRDRKVGRLKNIMLQMPGIEPGAFGGGTPEAAPKADVGPATHIWTPQGIKPVGSE